MKSRIFKVLACLAISISIQISLAGQAVHKQGSPPTLEIKLDITPSTVELPPLDYARLIAEDRKDKESGELFRFGYVHAVQYDLNNSGAWSTLANGDRVWKLRIYAPEAQTININYSQFSIPAGAELYIYPESQRDVLGPFTSQNHKVNNRFATGFTKGEYCIVEYYEPQSDRGEGNIAIDGIVHGYRSIRSEVNGALRAFQDSGQCNNDVNCNIGNGWQDQIKSVGLIMTANNSRFCTGALINNTGDDCRSYFLSANHCFANDNPGDVLNDIFMFNYDSPTPACPGTPTSDGPTNQTVQGATVIAKAVDSDFCLLELTVNPLNFYDVYYSGWDRTAGASTGAAGIHHPSGDVKKISFENATLQSGSFGGSPAGTHWVVPNWDQGTTEPGSSGSPLFDMTNQRIIGQLHGGGAACSGNTNNGASDSYGKINYSWDQNGNAGTAQLSSWLDPLGTGAMVMNGNDCTAPVSPVAGFAPANNSSYTFCSAGSIELSDASSGSPTSWSWTFSGAGVSPTSSTSTNPVVSVGSTGTLTATLVVTNAQGTDMISQTYPVTIDNCTMTGQCDTPAVAIPDNDPNGVSSTITMTGNDPIQDLNIDIDISHTYVGDIIITIEHLGVTATILDRPGFPASNFGCSQNDITAVFDDEGTAPAETTCNTGVAISGSVIPNQALSVFDGQSSGGVWTVTVSDNAGQDTGILNTWCLAMTTVAPLGPPCYSLLDNSNGLMQIETGMADYESSDWIMTTLPISIEPGAVVDYDAVDFIELNADFEVKLGAVFEAFIDGCNNGGGGNN